MLIEENEIVKQMIGILEDADWENIYSDEDTLVFKQVGANPDSDHIIKIIEEDGEFIVEESAEGDTIETLFVDPSAGSLSGFEELVDNTMGGIYYG